MTLPKVPAVAVPAATGAVAVSGDAAIYWASWGEGAPVVLLHGGLGSGDQWAFQIAALVAAKYRVIAIDTRGHARSTLGTAALSYHQFAEDTVAVLDALKLPKAAVAGWSDGGTTALDLAIHHADRVTALFVLDANFDASGVKPRGASKTFEAYGARVKAEFTTLAPKGASYAALSKAMKPVWKSEGGLAVEDLAKLTMPTTICAGAKDEIIEQAHFAALANAIPGAVLVVVADASHFALWQQPDAVNAALLGLLARASP